jgi:SNF2 family DNA or RNA helicase
MVLPSASAPCQRPTNANSTSCFLQVEAVREEIYRMKARDPAAKVIIFSQFTSMLDILHYRLTQVPIV